MRESVVVVAGFGGWDLGGRARYSNALSGGGCSGVVITRGDRGYERPDG